MSKGNLTQTAEKQQNLIITGKYKHLYCINVIGI